MKLTIVNISNKMPDWVNSACDEYLKRVNHGKYSCKIIEVKADKNPKKTVLENMEQESKKIENSLPKASYIIALDERGTNYDSIQFAHKLEKISLENSAISFIIGGADGIHPALRDKADLKISLSKMVFPHALVRVIILEQIYRAISILENHPYHRE